MTTDKITLRAVETDDGLRWTVALNLSTDEEHLLFGLTLLAGEPFDSMLDAATAVADAIAFDLHLARL